MLETSLGMQLVTSIDEGGHLIFFLHGILGVQRLTIDRDEMRFAIVDFGSILRLYEGHLRGNLLRIGAARRRCTRIRRQYGGHSDWSVIVRLCLIDWHHVNDRHPVRRCARLKYVFFLEQ